MGPLIGDLFPSAMAIALSPFPIVAVVLIAATPRAATNGPSFAAGWLVGISAAALLVARLSSGSEDPDAAAADGVHWGKVVLGALCLFGAARKWRSRPRAGAVPELPGWMTAVDTFSAGRSFVTGLLLSGVNPKNLALAAAAAATVAQSGLDEGDQLLAIAVFVVLSSLAVLGVVVARVVAPERSAAPLASIKDFMAANNAVIMMVVLLVIGAKLLGQGLGDLTA